MSKYLTGIRISGFVYFYKNRNDEDKNVNIKQETVHGDRICKQIKEAIKEILKQEHGLDYEEEFIIFATNDITVKQKGSSMERIFEAKST